jgi:hypothetical protein
MSDLYDTDIVLWSEHQAGLLRRRAAGELVNEADLDWPNIAEEIESVGGSERRSLASRIGTVIEHLLLKLEASPAVEPRAKWQETVIRARSDIDAMLEDSPSLRQKPDEMVGREMKRQRRLVADMLALYSETPRVPTEHISYDRDRVNRGLVALTVIRSKCPAIQQ